MDSKRVIKSMIDEVNHHGSEALCFMEVCGTHTQAISQSGIRAILHPNIRLLSGPGCPVCVTDEGYIDAAIEILNNYNVILATFGDMMRVKGTRENLSDQLNKRKSMVVVYSPFDCIELAKKNPDRQVLFFAVGFETTAPSIALTVKLAREYNLHNLTFLNSLKLMPPVLHSILNEKQKEIHGIICPGHVAAVKGAGYFRFITQVYGIPAVVCGFEALDIAGGLHYLAIQNVREDRVSFQNLYKACVNEDGNAAANKLLQEIYDIDGASWRGIGEIRNSALELCDKYSDLDAMKRFNIKLQRNSGKQQCNCGDVLMGNILPYECKFFGCACNPQNPMGPCMVSVEGACSISYRYRECEYNVGGLY